MSAFEAVTTRALAGGAMAATLVGIGNVSPFAGSARYLSIPASISRGNSGAGPTSLAL